MQPIIVEGYAPYKRRRGRGEMGRAGGHPTTEGGPVPTAVLRRISPSRISPAPYPSTVISYKERRVSSLLRARRE